MEKKGTPLMGRYELGKLLGQGTFAKVYHARNLKSGQSVAVKVIDKEKVMKVGLIDQIKREISVMKLVRHPNVVQLYEVMASKTKIYFVMEYAKGGELFNKVAKGKLKEDVARKYFQQLVASVDFCHSRGVYHRDLKPENLLLDENGNLKVSDFGLSALLETKRQDGLLHTTCGTPAYVAPEVINKRGYDGEKADIWSCGVVLFVLLAGYLPFQDPNLMEMYKKISRGEFKCPHWFPAEVRKLLSRILDPNPYTRITVAKLMENPWFKKGFKSVETPLPDLNDESSPRSLFDSNAAFESDSEVISDKKKGDPTTGGGGGGGGGDGDFMRPTCMNAFDIISLSAGFNLSGLFEKGNNQKSDERFTTTKPPSDIVSKLEEIAMMESFKVKKTQGMVKLQGSKEGRKGQLAINAEIFEVAPSVHMVEVRKAAGDTLEYRQFCNQGLKPSLKDIVWTWQGSAFGLDCWVAPLASLRFGLVSGLFSGLWEHVVLGESCSLIFWAVREGCGLQWVIEDVLRYGVVAMMLLG
ncbi:CBL-interacting serine/threonine-protein kinase 20 [Sarracenia purpurea var. burkii]